MLSIFSADDRYTSTYIDNYTNLYVLEELKRVPGAGQAQVMGVADQAMRIWMNPDRMTSRTSRRRGPCSRKSRGHPAR